MYITSLITMTCLQLHAGENIDVRFKQTVW